MVTCVLGTKVMDMRRYLFRNVGEQAVIMICVGTSNVDIIKT